VLLQKVISTQEDDASVWPQLCDDLLQELSTALMRIDVLKIYPEEDVRIYGNIRRIIVNSWTGWSASSRTWAYPS
jgi:hypothetical protein